MNIQDEAYSEAMAEIERLKDKIRGLERLNQMTDEEVVMELKAEIEGLESLNQEERQTIGDLAKLCLRAADALETSSPLIGAEDYADKLIAELREAAG